MSELFELKNQWFNFNKKISLIISVLPKEVLERYELAVKSLQLPIFDVTRYPTDNTFLATFNEVVYKMAQYYFTVFQAVFTKDTDSFKPQITEFLKIKDPIHRSRKAITYYEEMHQLIEKKIFYYNKITEEMREKSKTVLLESAY